MAAITLRNHPQLVADWETYAAIADLMTNDIKRVHKYLIPHASELDALGSRNFQNRKDRLVRVNHTKPYARIHASHMSQPISVGGAEDKRLDIVVKDATGFKQSLTQVARDRLKRFVRDGKVGTLVDSPAVIAKDRETARATKERSYQVLYDACDIRYWDVFREGPRKGQFKEVVLAEPFSGKKQRFRRLLIGDSANAKYQWQILEAKKTGFLSNAADDFQVEIVPNGEGEGGIGRIPFVVFGGGPEDSLISDVWPLDIAAMNMSSVKQNIVYNQGFQRSILAGVSPEEISKMSEFTVTLIQNVEARIFTIEAGNPQAATEEILKLERQIDRRGKFEYNQLAEDTRQVQSADSKSKDLKTREAVYTATVEYEESVESEIVKLHAEFEGVDPERVAVTIGRDFGLKDEQAEQNKLALVFSHAREMKAHRLRKEILRIEASNLDYLPTEDEDAGAVKAAVLAEIADLPDELTPGASPISPFSGGIFDTLT